MRAGTGWEDLRIPDRPRGRRVAIRVDGREVPAYTGETLFAALTAAGIRVLRHASPKAGPETPVTPVGPEAGPAEQVPASLVPRTGAARGGFCGMGVCQECRVTVDGRPDQRACMTEVREGMEVETDAP